MRELKDLLSTYRTTIGVFLVWLFHLSGLIGIYLGYEDWFISKTPLNLFLSGLLFIWIYPLSGKKAWLLFLLCGLLGIAAEWIGVHTGWLFGDYTYGENLGPKIFEVPLLIGLNWALLTFITGNLSRLWLQNRKLQMLAGALLMLLLDFFMEAAAPHFDYWEFKGGIAPLWNYVCWFLLAFLLQGIFQKTEQAGNSRFSAQLLLAQLVFFIAMFFRY